MSIDARASIVSSSYQPGIQYIESLRQEVDAVISEEGWTKGGIDKIHKLDSFIREAKRL